MAHNPKTSPTEHVVAACIQGERTAQFELYRRYRSVLFGICLRYADSKATAEDLLQESFVQIFSRLDQFRGDGSFEGWLRRIAVHTAAGHYRQRAKTLPLLELTDLPDDSAPWTGPGDCAEAELLELIQRLPDGCRTVFNLYVVEGYSHREIAELLGISDGASRSQLAYARKKLTTTLTALAAPCHVPR